MSYPHILSAIDAQIELLQKARQILISPESSLAESTVLDTATASFPTPKTAARAPRGRRSRRVEHFETVTPEASAQSGATLLEEDKPASQAQVATIPATAAEAIAPFVQPRLVTKAGGPGSGSTVAGSDAAAVSKAPSPAPVKHVGKAKPASPVVAGALQGARPAGPVFVPARAVQIGTGQKDSAASNPEHPVPDAAPIHPGATLDAMLRAYAQSQMTSADAALTARVREFIGA